MNNKYLKIIIHLIFAMISVIGISYGHKLIVDNHLNVPGTVIGKFESVARRPYKPFLTYTKWWLSVKPYDSKYKDFNVCVDYEYYSGCDVGTNVNFNVASDQVDPNGHSDFLGLLIFVSGLVGCVVSIVSIIKLIIDNVSD